MLRLPVLAAALLISIPAHSGELRQMEGDILILLQDEEEAARVERPVLDDMGIIGLTAVFVPEFLKRKFYKTVSGLINDEFKKQKIDKYAVASVKSSCPTTPWLFWRPQPKGWAPQPEGYFQFPPPDLTCVEIHVIDAKAIAKTKKAGVLVDLVSGLNFSIEGYVNASIIHQIAKIMSDKGFAFYTTLSGSHIGAQPESSLIRDMMQKLQKKDEKSR